MVDLVPHSSIQGTARPAHYCNPSPLMLVVNFRRDLR